MRLETASASVAKSELDLCDIPSFLEVLGRDVRIPPQHSMYTNKCHLSAMTNRSQILCPTGHSGQSKAQAQAQVPAHHNKEELSHPLYTNTPGPWTSLLWPQQGIKSQITEIHYFSCHYQYSSEFVTKMTYASMEHSGVARQSLQLQHTEWCMVNQYLHHKLNSTKNPKPVASSALN